LLSAVSQSASVPREKIAEIAILELIQTPAPPWIGYPIGPQGYGLLM